MSLILRRQSTQTWEATEGGSVTPLNDPAAPGAHRLTSANRSEFGRFVAVPVPNPNRFRLKLRMRGRDYHLLYIEVRTSHGRRVFKVNPGNYQAQMRFGYRYELGFGNHSRDGDWHEYTLHLWMIARILEPRVRIRSIESVTARVTGSMDLVLLNANTPPPPTPTATVPPTVTAIPPTSTPVPPTVPPTSTAVPPTSTSVPPTSTPVPPTSTAVPPTATPIPPTSTAVPPTATAIPPTATALPPTATPTPLPTVPPEPGNLSRAQAVRFLNQSTFGANRDLVEALVLTQDLPAWINSQWAEPQSETMPYILSLPSQGNRQNRHEIWWQNAVNGEDHLRQRVQFALSEIFVISDLDYVIGNNQAAACHYYDMLGRLADGNFRDLMTEVTLHPIMGIYLSHLRNQRPDPERNIRPDENYARELMQLFTIGLYELAPDGEVRTNGGAPVPAFNLPIIEAFARVFTGWNYSGVESMTSNNIDQDRYWLPMTPVEAFHDTEAKTLLNGVTLPAGQSARQDLDAALDNIFNHPNVGPFVARSLIQRLVTSNPSRGYVSRVARRFENNGAGVRGDLRATVSAVLLDSEARSETAREASDFGKVKEPMLRLLQVWRAFDVQPAPQVAPRYVVYADHLLAIDNTLGQAPLKANSVFNFFSPTYSPAGTTLSAPEMQILTEANLASTNDMFHDLIFTDNTQSGRTRPTPSVIDFTDEIAIAADLDALIAHLDVLLFGGTMPNAIAQALRSHLAGLPADDEGRYLRVVEAVFICVGSPAFMVQR